LYYFYNGIGEYYLYCIQVCFREIRSATSVLGCPRVHTNRGSDSEALNDACIIVISSNPTWSPDGSLDSRSRLFLINYWHACVFFLGSISSFSSISHSAQLCPYILPVFFPNDKKEMSLGARKLSDVPCQIRALARTHVLAHVWNLSGEW